MHAKSYVFVAICTHCGPVILGDVFNRGDGESFTIIVEGISFCVTWVLKLETLTVTKCMSTILHFLKANISFDITCKGLKIMLITKFHKL